MTTLDNTAVSRLRSPDLIPGYRLEKLVGKGGMGEVHQAVQLSLNRVVALKLLAPNLAQDRTFVTRFEKEAAALASLSHPNIVSIVDKGKANNTYYLVMEFVDGPSLREVMRSPALDTHGSLRRMLEICRAVDYAHTRGVVHRDLKPENILFDEQAGGIAKVTDFGLAGFLEDKNSRFNVTETRVSMGTLAYMAPEQRVDAKGADHRADIFSIGVLLYELLVGDVPMGTFDPPSHRSPGVDRRLDAIVSRCLKPIPQDRYQRVSELIADLEPLVPQSFTAPQGNVSKLERFKREARRLGRKALRVTAIATVAAAVFVLGIAAIRSHQRPTTRPLPGFALAGDLRPEKASTLAGTLNDSPDTRRILLGDGSEPLAVVLNGRPVKLDKGVEFPLAGDDAAGRVTMDVVDEKGVAMQWSADVTVSTPTPSFFRSVKAALLGSTFEPQSFSQGPRAALLLLGSAGRYVAVVMSANGGPLLLEWGLGEKRGAMLGPPSPKDGKAHLRLVINPRGELRAFWGPDREVGEAISLGEHWQDYFGRSPAPAVGCLEGACTMARLRLEVLREAPPAGEPSSSQAPFADMLPSPDEAQPTRRTSSGGTRLGTTPRQGGRHVPVAPQSKKFVAKAPPAFSTPKKKH